MIEGKTEKYKYEAIFVDKEGLEPFIERHLEGRLERPIADMHVTLAYKPERFREEFFGVKATVTAIGYGNDGENEGLLVTVCCENDELQALYDEIEVPHITLSISDTGKAVNTRYLEFEPIEPFTIEGVFGPFPRCE